MKRTTAMIAAGMLAVGGCQTSMGRPAPVTGTQAIVERNVDSAAVLAQLRQRGIIATPADVSRAEFLRDDPGYAYRVGPEWLHLHVYPSPAAAATARARFITGSATSIIDWVGKPHLFQCGTALALYIGVQPEPIAALTQTCGAPAFPR